MYIIKTKFKPMKALIVTALSVLSVAGVSAQVGVGTTSPNSTLDVRGSLATAYRSFTANSTASISDNMLVFTGTAAATLTLPDAAGCAGRSYWIKNVSSNTSLLTIATTSSQTIEGLVSWLLDEFNEGIHVVSNGANWYITSQTLPTGSGTYWSQGGNSVASLKKLGTINNYDLPFITNNTEKMRITTAGNVGIGSTNFDPDNPEKLLVDAGNTTSNTLIGASGTYDNFLQMNIQNFSNGNNASTDFVATANNGTDNSTYIDMGINSQGYTNSNSNILNGSNTAYVYANAADFYIGNGATGRPLIFFTNTGAVGNTTANGLERMRITAAGNVGINSTTPSEKLTVGGNIIPDGNYNIGTSTYRWNTIYATNGVINTSDMRMKTNIEPLQYGLNEVLALEPVRYNWINKPTTDNQIGLIAQQVRKIVPEVVVGNEEKETLGMNYAELVPVLINAIKDLKKDLEETKKELSELKKQVSNNLSSK